MVKLSIRSLVSAALVSSSLAVEAQDLSQRVTFRSTASTAKALLKKLSDQTGVVFVTSALTANEVLAVDVADVPLSSLIQRIAEVAGAEWEKDSEGYRLVRSQGLANRQDREYLSARAASISVDIERRARELEASGPFDAQAARRAYELAQGSGEEVSVSAGVPAVKTVRTAAPRVASEAPVHRAMTRVLAAIGAYDLAAIPAGSRIVYAISPTPMQRKMPPAALRAIETFVVEQQRYAQASPISREQQDDVRRDFVGDGSLPRALHGGVSEALLVVTRLSSSDDLQFELKIADQTGQFVARSFRSVSVSDPSRIVVQHAKESPRGLDQRLTLSEEALAHARLMLTPPGGGSGSVQFTMSGDRTLAIRLDLGSAGMDATPGPTVSEDWRSKLAYPDRYDPLGFAVSELVFGFAKARGTNVVACIPDSALVTLSRRAVQPITARELREILESQVGVIVDETDGWTLVRPRYPSLARSERVDRAALGNVLRSIVQEGRLTLDALGRYALNRRTPPRFMGLESLYIARVEPSATSILMQASANWRMLQLYAQLDPARRSALAEGAALPLGALTPQQAATVHSMVFDEASGPTRTPPVALGSPPAKRPDTAYTIISPSSIGELPVVFNLQAESALMDERTEYLPLGVPRDGVLTLRWSREPIALAAWSKDPSTSRFLTASELAATTAMPALGLETAAGAAPAFDQFRSGSALRMTFELQLTPEASLTRELQEVGLDGRGGWLSYDQLPPEFRAKVEEVRRKLSDLNAGGVRSRVLKPPPS